VFICSTYLIGLLVLSAPSLSYIANCRMLHVAPSEERYIVAYNVSCHPLLSCLPIHHRHS
jgi:hypothetical protein